MRKSWGNRERHVYVEGLLHVGVRGRKTHQHEILLLAPIASQIQSLVEFLFVDVQQKV